MSITIRFDAERLKPKKKAAAEHRTVLFIRAENLGDLIGFAQVNPVFFTWDKVSQSGFAYRVMLVPFYIDAIGDQPNSRIDGTAGDLLTYDIRNGALKIVKKVDKGAMIKRLENS